MKSNVPKRWAPPHPSAIIAAILHLNENFLLLQPTSFWGLNWQMELLKISSLET